MNGEQLNVAIDEHRVHNFNQIGDDDYMVDAERDLVDIKGKSIPIASAVTSYARMKLYSLMNAIQNKGHRVVYSDTDSIITDCNLRNFPDLMLKFMPDGCGNELGSLKNEALDKVSKKLSKADTLRQVSHDDGELYFDECQILAPKVYSLRKKLINGEVIEIAKMKGVKRSSFDEQTQLLNG
jgi:DNA polymerase elongation subunit (family B)